MSGENHQKAGSFRLELRVAFMLLALGLFGRPVVARAAEPGDAEPLRSADPQSATSGADDEWHLSDAAELDRIIELYMAGEYESCTKELGRLLDPEDERHFEEPAVIERGRLYFASCSLLAGDRGPARQALIDALEENPLMSSPDSLTFPPPVVGLFLEARDEVQQLIARREQEELLALQKKAAEAEAQAVRRRERELELRRLAEEELVIQKSSRWVASLPFGAGQFQSGKTGLGAFFLVSEALSAGALTASGVVLSDLGAQAASGVELDREQYDAARNTSFTVAVASAWTLLGLSAIGILEAHLTYRPERVVDRRRRALPASLTGDIDRDDAGPSDLTPGPSDPAATRGGESFVLLPLAGPTQGGFIVGASGRF